MKAGATVDIDEAVVSATAHNYLEGRDILRLLLTKTMNRFNNEDTYDKSSTRPVVHELQAAAMLGHEEWVRLLLRQDHRHKGGYFGTPLQAAAYGGYFSIIEMLQKAGENIHAIEGHFGNSLQAAAFAGHTHVVRYLIGAGVMNSIHEGYFGTAFQAAAYNGHLENLKILLDHGANINETGGAYGFALQAAAYKKHENVVRYLLDAGATENPGYGKYSSAIEAAMSLDEETVTERLLVRQQYETPRNAPSRNSRQKMRKLKTKNVAKYGNGEPSGINPNDEDYTDKGNLEFQICHGADSSTSSSENPLTFHSTHKIASKIAMISRSQSSRFDDRDSDLRNEAKFSMKGVLLRMTGCSAIQLFMKRKRSLY